MFLPHKTQLPSLLLYTQQYCSKGQLEATMNTERVAELDVEMLLLGAAPPLKKQWSEESTWDWDEEV